MGAQLAIKRAGRAGQAPEIEPPRPAVQKPNVAAPLTIEASHRPVPAAPHVPAVAEPAAPEPDFRFYPNGRLLHSGESFLRQGRRGKW